MLLPISTTGCISFDSYIKPQRDYFEGGFCGVVYLLIPTSNHNTMMFSRFILTVVYLLIPTSNHNLHNTLLNMLMLYIF